MKNYEDYYGQSIAIIGQAEKGDILNPFLIETLEDAIDIFGGGELVDAYRQIDEVGAEFVHLIRIDYDSRHHKYQVLEQAYEVIEAIREVDVILPLGVKLDEYIIDYPDLTIEYEDFVYQKETDTVFETNYSVHQINYVKINENITNNYEVNEDDDENRVLIEITESLEDNDVIEVSYNAFRVIDFKFDILAFQNKKIKKSLSFRGNIDFNDTEAHSLKEDFSEYFDYISGDDLTYSARCELPYISVDINRDGTGSVTARLDFDKYVEQKSQKNYFVLSLAESCSRANSIGILKPPTYDEQKLISLSYEIKEILNRGQETDFGKYIVSSGSKCLYGSGSNSKEIPFVIVLAGLIGTLSTDKSPSNKSIDNIGIVDEPSTDRIESLTQAGFTMLYNSVRNGKVPYRAVTMAKDDSNPFISLKNIRVTNEVASRIKSITDEFIGRSSYNAEDEIEPLVKGLLSKMVQEGKIKDSDFNIPVTQRDYIKTKLSLELFNEVDSVNAGILSRM